MSPGWWLWAQLWGCGSGVCAPQQGFQAGSPSLPCHAAGQSRAELKRKRGDTVTFQCNILASIIELCILTVLMVMS